MRLRIGRSFAEVGSGSPRRLLDGGMYGDNIAMFIL